MINRILLNPLLTTQDDIAGNGVGSHIASIFNWEVDGSMKTYNKFAAAYALRCFLA